MKKITRSFKFVIVNISFLLVFLSASNKNSSIQSLMAKNAKL